MAFVFLPEQSQLEVAAEAPRLPASLPRCSWPCEKCSDTYEGEFTLEEPCDACEFGLEEEIRNRWLEKSESQSTLA